MWRGFKRWALLPKPHRLWEDRKHALRFFIVIAVLIFLGFRLSRVWVFEYAGLATGDTISRLRKPEHASKTAVVIITADERRDLLGGKIEGHLRNVIVSPIPGDRLLRSVCSILRQGPRVLGVDLNTSDVVLEELPRTETIIVWSRGIKFVREPAANPDGFVLRVEPEIVLANKHPDALTGLALVPVLADWSVRNVDRCYAYNSAQVALTFVGAIEDAYHGRQPSECMSPEGDEVGSARINYKYDRFTLSDFAPDSLSQADIDACLAGTGEFQKGASVKSPLTDKVVLLGGEYDSQDWHPTPFGLRPGVEVVAGMTEHLFQDSGAKEMGLLKEIAVKVSLALLIAFIHSRLKPMAALLFSILVLGTLVMAGNVLAVLFTAYRATTVPFLIGIVIEQLVTSAERAQDAEAEETTESQAVETG
jgi:hypothetical protein